MACSNCSDPKAVIRRAIVGAVSQAVSRAIEAQQLAAPRVIPNMGDIVDAAEAAIGRLMQARESAAQGNDADPEGGDGEKQQPEEEAFHGDKMRAEVLAGLGG